MKTVEPVTVSGWYVCADGSWVEYTWVNGRLTETARELRCISTEGYTVRMPDREVTEDLPTCMLVPLRGFQDRVAVMDGDGECIGWIRTDRGV